MRLNNPASVTSSSPRWRPRSASAAENPFRFPRLRRSPEVRRVLTQRFPYRVFFIRRTDDIVVFRVLHGARHDREWKSNIPET